MCEQAGKYSARRRDTPVRWAKNGQAEAAAVPKTSCERGDDELTWKYFGLKDFRIPPLAEIGVSLTGVFVVWGTARRRQVMT